MIYRVLADGVVLLHFAFILFVIQCGILYCRVAPYHRRQDVSPRLTSVTCSIAGVAGIVCVALAVVVFAGPQTSWWPPDPSAGGERLRDRDKMVTDQIASPGWTRDAVADEAVLEAMRAAPRHVFVPSKLRSRAYDDTPLPIGHGQTISQPYMVAVMTELLELTPESKVLEIGTGSGYQAAVLAHLTPHVYTIEILEPLAKQSTETLEEQGYTGVRTRHADGYHGWPDAAPFDAIIVTCAAGHLPSPLWDQLAPGGRIVIPIGGTYSVQRLVVVEKTPDGKRKSESVMGVRFVPMTGQVTEE
jgi:protein-L-isoaspartate(D-aspartate) O-methyltransferase